MSDSAQVRELFDTLAKVLLRSTILGFLLLLVTFGAYLLGGEMFYQTQGGMFDLSKHELDLIFYCFLGFMKTLVLLFFLFPWIAIRLVLRQSR